MLSDIAKKTQFIFAYFCAHVPSLVRYGGHEMPLQRVATTP